MRWFLLAVLTTAYGAGAFGMLGISPLSPILVEGFALTRLQVAFLIPSIYVGGLFFSLPGGRLADRLGVRRSFLGGLALGAVGLLAGAGAPAFPTFLLCLFVAGIGWSVVNPALGRAIIDLFPARERGIAMGIKQMGLTVGGFVAALVLPTIAHTLGWRAAIVACALVVGLPVVLTWPLLASLDTGAPAPEPGISASQSERRPVSQRSLAAPSTRRETAPPACEHATRTPAPMVSKPRAWTA